MIKYELADLGIRTHCIPLGNQEHCSIYYSKTAINSYPHVYVAIGFNVIVMGPPLDPCGCD